MDTLKALAETTMKVSEAKSTLIKLEETETEYLVAREKLAMERIQKVHDDSAEILKQTQTNYVDAQALLATVSTAASFMDGAYTRFTELTELFNARNAAWEANCATWEAEVTKTKNQIKVEQVKIENGKKANEQMVLKLANDQRKLDSDRGTIERAVARLKENRI